MRQNRGCNPIAELVLVLQALRDRWTQYNLTSDIEQMCQAEASITAPASQSLTEVLRNIGLQHVSARDAMVAAVTGALGRLRTPDLLPELWAWYLAERALDVARTAYTPSRSLRNMRTTLSTAKWVPRFT